MGYTAKRSGSNWAKHIWGRTTTFYMGADDVNKSPSMIIIYFKDLIDVQWLRHSRTPVDNLSISLHFRKLSPRRFFGSKLSLFLNLDLILGR